MHPSNDLVTSSTKRLTLLAAVVVWSVCGDWLAAEKQRSYLTDLQTELGTKLRISESPDVFCAKLLLLEIRTRLELTCRDEPG